MKRLQKLQEVLGQLEIIELSHSLEEHMPIWPTHSRFLHTLWHSYWHGDVATDYQLLINEHNGTHVDAPAHFIKEGPHHLWIDEIPVDRFFGPCVTLDLSFLGPMGKVTKKHITDWEKTNGPIRKGDIVLFNLGWSQYWRLRPKDQEYIHNWPGLGGEAAQYLVEKGVKMVGVDTLAVDIYGSKDNPAHYTLLGNSVLILENLKNLDKLPRYAYFMGLPLPIKGGTASPVRAVAFVEKEYAKKE